MARSYDELIKEVLLKHGIALGEEDPILVLHTINRALAEDLAAQLTEAMGVLRSDLEELYLRWDAEARAKAERILSAAMAAAQDHLHAEAQKAIEPAARELLADLMRSEKRREATARRLQWILACGLIVIAGLAAVACFAKQASL